MWLYHLSEDQKTAVFYKGALWWKKYAVASKSKEGWWKWDANGLELKHAEAQAIHDEETRRVWGKIWLDYKPHLTRAIVVKSG